MLLFTVVCLFCLLFTVVKERKKRQDVEKRLKQVEKMAEQLTRHYDNCFIQLAKDVR